MSHTSSHLPSSLPSRDQRERFPQGSIMFNLNEGKFLLAGSKTEASLEADLAPSCYQRDQYAN
jgi:hypothetical protein